MVCFVYRRETRHQNVTIFLGLNAQILPSYVSKHPLLSPV